MATSARYSRISSLILIVYLAVGAIVASNHNYFQHVDSIKAGAEAALAVILWPLVLVGWSMHF